MLHHEEPPEKAQYNMATPPFCLTPPFLAQIFRPAHFHQFELCQYSRRECLEVVGIPSSVDDKNLQCTVCSILGDIDVVCDSNDIEDCHRIKGDRTKNKFSSRRKSSEVLNKKKKLRNLDIGKYGLNDGSRIYINDFEKTIDVLPCVNSLSC